MPTMFRKYTAFYTHCPLLFAYGLPLPLRTSASSIRRCSLACENSVRRTKHALLVDLIITTCNNNNTNNNYDNLYGAVTRPYRYKGALQATTLGRPALANR